MLAWLCPFLLILKYQTGRFWIKTPTYVRLKTMLIHFEKSIIVGMFSFHISIRTYLNHNIRACLSKLKLTRKKSKVTIIQQNLLTRKNSMRMIFNHAITLSSPYKFLYFHKLEIWIHQAHLSSIIYSFS